MNRGSLAEGIRIAALAAASMRPRFMNRGSAAPLGGGQLLGPTGFNEAPIHESGKWSAARAASSRLRRFNEAPIHESGK